MIRRVTALTLRLHPRVVSAAAASSAQPTKGISQLTQRYQAHFYHKTLVLHQYILCCCWFPFFLLVDHFNFISHFDFFQCFILFFCIMFHYFHFSFSLSCVLFRWRYFFQIKYVRKEQFLLYLHNSVVLCVSGARLDMTMYSIFFFLCVFSGFARVDKMNMAKLVIEMFDKIISRSYFPIAEHSEVCLWLIIFAITI